MLQVAHEPISMCSAGCLCVGWAVVVVVARSSGGWFRAVFFHHFLKHLLLTALKALQREVHLVKLLGGIRFVEPNEPVSMRRTPTMSIRRRRRD